MRAAPKQELSGSDYSMILSVERGLEILGPTGKETTVRYLARSGLTMNEIPHNLDAFIGFLRVMFGHGATIIEAEIEANLRLLENLRPCRTTLSDAARELADRRGSE